LGQKDDSYYLDGMKSDEKIDFICRKLDDIREHLEDIGYEIATEKYGEVVPR